MLDIANPLKQAESQHRTSHRMTASLVKHITEQSGEQLAEAQEEQFEAKWTARCENHQAKTTEAKNLLTTLPNSLHKAVKLLGPPRGLLLYWSLNMDLLSTKGHFVMHSACGMAGDHHYYHHSASVTGVSQ